MRIPALATFIALFAIADDAAADRPVTDAERTKLSAAIAAAGCTGGKLEFDDGRFEADDVICSDGKKYDLKFDDAFKLVQKKLED